MTQKTGYRDPVTGRFKVNYRLRARKQFAKYWQEQVDRLIYEQLISTAVDPIAGSSNERHRPLKPWDSGSTPSLRYQFRVRCRTEVIYLEVLFLFAQLAQWQSSCFVSSGSSVQSRHWAPRINGEWARYPRMLCTQSEIGASPIFSTKICLLSSMAERRTFNP